MADIWQSSQIAGQPSRTHRTYEDRKSHDHPVAGIEGASLTMFSPIRYLSVSGINVNSAKVGALFEPKHRYFRLNNAPLIRVVAFAKFSVLHRRIESAAVSCGSHFPKRTIPAVIESASMFCRDEPYRPAAPSVRNLLR